MSKTIFDSYIARWQLVPDGELITTQGAKLLPVLVDHQPAVLKLSFDRDEQRGAALLNFWGGDGAVRALAQHGAAVLMERATGSRSLAEFARTGRDDEASRVLCSTAARLHARRGVIPDGFVPLRRWFAALETAASQENGLFAMAWDVARALLADPRDVVALHGDLHHMNVLDGGARGWLAIDPKCVLGERGFEFAVILSNPDSAVALAPDRLSRQVTVIAQAAMVDPDRLLRWSFAQAALSAAWHIEDDGDPRAALALAQIASAAISSSGVRL